MRIFYTDNCPISSSKTLTFILDKYYGISVLDGDIIKNESGKPYLKSGQIHFNISHTSGMIMFAVSNFAVGIDVENINRKIKWEKIASKYFDKKEIDGLSSPKDFFSLWTKKESAIKFIGKTLSSSLIKTRFSDDQPLGESGYENAKTKTFFLGDFVYSITSKDDDFELIKL